MINTTIAPDDAAWVFGAARWTDPEFQATLRRLLDMPDPWQDTVDLIAEVTAIKEDVTQEVSMVSVPADKSAFSETFKRPDVSDPWQDTVDLINEVAEADMREAWLPLL